MFDTTAILIDAMETDTPLDFSSPIKEYRAGDTITCEIRYKAKGGFALTLPYNDVRHAFLPTSLELTPGDLIRVFFVCYDGSKILVSMTEDEFRKHTSTSRQTSS